MYALATALKIPLPFAVGIMEMLWHFTGASCPQGDIGSLPDAAIAEAAGWPKKPSILIDVLVQERWFDRDPEHRLIVHDWPDHCEYEVFRKLLKQGKDFLPVYGKTARNRREFCSESARESPGTIREDSEKIPASRGAKAKALASESVNSSENLWKKSGFDDEADFDGWWARLVQSHPNRHQNNPAKRLVLEKIQAGLFNREDFGRGYKILAKRAGPDWRKDHGKFAPNLYTMLHDRLCELAAGDEKPACEKCRGSGVTMRPGAALPDPNQCTEEDWTAAVAAAEMPCECIAGKGNV